MTDIYRKKLIHQGSINAVLLTAVLSFLMHPLVFFGYKFPDLGFLAWFHLVPLVLGIHHYSFRHKFILAFAAGMVAHYGHFYWLLTAMQQFGNLNFFESFGALTILFIVLSFVFALCLSLACWTNHLIKIPLFLLLPIFMTTKDYLLHIFPFNGFPWEMVAYSQGSWLQFFQWIDVTSVYGLSFLIYLVNGLIAEGLLIFIHKRQIDKMVIRFVVAFVLLLVSLSVSYFSDQNYEQNKVSAGAKNIALVQGNIPQEIKWDPLRRQDHLGVYLNLTNTAVRDGAELVIWPETAFPYGIRKETLSQDQFLDKDRLATPLFFGAVITENQGSSDFKLYNSLLFANQEAKFEDFYSKVHLVPFGEYLPWKELFGFLSGLTEGVGEFQVSSGLKIFEAEGIKYGPQICFEDIFPDYSRELSSMGAQVLVNVTNDAWYGFSSALFQHLVFSQFRALENRRYLLRTTNTGITAVVDPRGQVVAQLPLNQSGFLAHNLKIDYYDSYFVRNGFEWIKFLVGLCAFVVLYTALKKRLGPVQVEF